MITYGVVCVTAGWLESKRVNDSAVTAIVAMIMIVARCATTFKIWLQNIKEM